jgi:hypothetical protein
MANPPLNECLQIRKRNDKHKDKVLILDYICTYEPLDVNNLVKEMISHEIGDFAVTF